MLARRVRQRHELQPLVAAQDKDAVVRDTLCVSHATATTSTFPPIYSFPGFHPGLDEFHFSMRRPTWEFNPESGAVLDCDALRCDALSGALDVALFASSGTVWSRDLQASRGQWPPPAVRERRANPS